MKLQMSFGENLINLRKQKGWSQDDLADNLDLSRQAISKWENDTSKPDIDNIKKISKIFSVNIDDLLNNDVVKDKAVTLNVKKVEKKERITTIVKCMIIAVIILYIINVIFKFASLLIIVNGIQKYANLSNYHYVITTYDENGLVEKEECWFKDGVSKTVNSILNGEKVNSTVTFINYNDNYGFVKSDNSNNYTEINVQNYKLSHLGYEDGRQLYTKFPSSISKNDMLHNLFCLNSVDISYSNYLLIRVNTDYVIIDKLNLIPKVSYKYDEKHEQIKNCYYEIEINCVKDINNNQATM